MQISVFLRNQVPSPEAPVHHRCTLSFARRLQVAFPHLVLLNEEGRWLRLLTADAWSSVKGRLRNKVSTKIEALNPATYHACTMLSYPPSGQESDARVRQRRLWEGAVRF